MSAGEDAEVLGHAESGRRDEGDSLARYFSVVTSAWVAPLRHGALKGSRTRRLGVANGGPP